MNLSQVHLDVIEVLLLSILILINDAKQLPDYHLKWTVSDAEDGRPSSQSSINGYPEAINSMPSTILKGPPGQAT